MRRSPTVVSMTTRVSRHSALATAGDAPEAAPLNAQDGAGIGAQTSIWPGIALTMAAAAAAFGFQRLFPTVSPLLVSIIAGVALTNAWAIPAVFAPGMKMASRRLLRIGIVLLGLQLALDDVFGLGWGMIAVVVAIVGFGALGTLAIGKALGVPPMQRLLIACGFSICGAAAVAAVEEAAGAQEDDVAASIGLVVLYGTAMIGIAPALLGAMELTNRQEGLIAGGAIHEVAQVVAAGGIIGGGALSAAVVVKLARVLMLAPVILTIGVIQRRPGSHVSSKRPPLVPLFVAGFLSAAVLRTFAHLPEVALTWGRMLQTVLLSAAMFAVGCGVKVNTLKKVGGRIVVLGALSTALVLAIAIVGVLLAG